MSWFSSGKNSSQWRSFSSFSFWWQTPPLLNWKSVYVPLQKLFLFALTLGTPHFHVRLTCCLIWRTYMLFITIDILHWDNWVRPFMLNGSNKRYERKKNLTCPWGINCIKLSVLFEVPSLNSDVFSFAALTFCAFVSDSFKYSKNQNSLPFLVFFFFGWREVAHLSGRTLM